MRRMSEAGLRALCQWEQGPEGGPALKVYLDSAGKETIGYGHLVKAGESFSKGISPQGAIDILREDVVSAERCVNMFLLRPVEQHQFDALVMLTFNVGGGAFSKSTVLKMVNEGEIAKAAAGFMLFDKIRVNGVLKFSQGLCNRRNAERDMFLGRK